MNSNRCLQCGFLNFISAEVCKRCQATLPEVNQYDFNQTGFDPYWNNAENPAGIPPGAYWNGLPPSPQNHAGSGNGGSIAALVIVLCAAYFLRIYLFVDGREGCGTLSMSYELGRFTGYLLLIGLICHLIWRFLFQRTKRKLALNILIVAIGALTIWQIYTEYNAQKITKTTVRRLISKNGGLAANPGFLQKDTSPYPSGRFERVGRVMEDYVIDMHNEGAAFLADVEALGPDNFLAPETLVHLESLQRKRRQIADLLASMDRHEEQIKKLARHGDAALSSTHLEGCIEREFVAGARMAFSTISQQASEFFSIQRESFKHINLTLAFLEERVGRYVARDNQLIFSTNADKIEYNYYMERLEEWIEREDQWLRQAQANQAKYIKGLETFAK